MKNKFLFLIGLAIIFLVVAITIVSSIQFRESCQDDDDDGVCNTKDICPNSKKAEKIDVDGCDPFQFCERFSCGGSCFNADFLGNENNTLHPNDCTVVILAKEGSYDPRCVPLDCRKTLKIPESIVNFKTKFPFDLSYVEATLSNVSSGYDVLNGKYLGWCVDEANNMNPGTIYHSKLYSSYDPDLAIKCPYCADPDWDMVNYIINYKRGDAIDVQAAIWYFVDGGIYPSDPDAIAMVEDALAYGEGFVPREGQNMAIIVDNGSRIQLIIIEVDP